MYGSEVGTTTTALAATGLGLAAGSWFLAGVGIILAGVAVWMLFRRESKTRP